MLHWIARDGVVYGPYETEVVRQLASSGALTITDQVCPHGTEDWVPWFDWLMNDRPTPPPLPPAREPEFWSGPHASGATAGATRKRSAWNTSLMQMFNSERGHGHPLKYVSKRTAQDVARWLNLYYPDWQYVECDDNGWPINLDETMDQWIAPAIAKLYPQLIKKSYWHHFGPGKKWRILE